MIIELDDESYEVTELNDYLEVTTLKTNSKQLIKVKDYRNDEALRNSFECQIQRAYYEQIVWGIWKGIEAAVRQMAGEVLCRGRLN